MLQQAKRNPLHSLCRRQDGLGYLLCAAETVMLTNRTRAFVSAEIRIAASQANFGGMPCNLRCTYPWLHGQARCCFPVCPHARWHISGSSSRLHWIIAVLQMSLLSCWLASRCIHSLEVLFCCLEKQPWPGAVMSHLSLMSSSVSLSRQVFACECHLLETDQQGLLSSWQSYACMSEGMQVYVP